jgi:hypothetical protein
MKKIKLLTVAVLFFLTASAQSDSLKWVKEINEQVWKPFITHFISNNTAGFSSVHSKRIARVQIDDNIIKNYQNYFPVADTNTAKNKKNADRLFELRFDKRISNGTQAWESGYYKGTVMQQGKTPQFYYGRFFVVLEKENATWKILVDADTGKDADEENFNKAFAMESKQ